MCIFAAAETTTCYNAQIMKKSLLRILILALAAVYAIGIDAQPTIYGNLIYHDDWTGEGSQKYGYYAINASDGSYKPISPTDSYFYNGNGGAFVGSDGIVRIVNKDSQYGTDYLTYYAYDFQTWKPAEGLDEYGLDLNDYSLMATDMSEDPITGKVYGCFLNAQNTAYNLGVVDFFSRTRTTIANYGVTPVLALAFNNQGVLYGVKKDGYLYIINTQTGEQAEVGDLGFNLCELPQSMTCDLATGRLYLAAQMQDFSSALYEIDPATCEATLLCEFPKGEEFTGLYIPAPSISEDAPAQVENLAADFPKGALSGHVNFTLPAKTQGGTLLTGSVGYTLRANGDDAVVNGSGAPGENVSVSLTLKNGFQTVSVGASNEAGEGGRKTITLWAGADTPKAPAKAMLTVSKSGEATVQWSAVGEEGINGGYVDTDKLTYTIVRMPENTVVEEGLTATEWAQTLPDDAYAEYRYTITAVCGTLTSEATTTNAVKYGRAFTPPFSATFDTADDFNLFSYLSLNGDKFHWSWYDKENEGGVALCPNTDVPADDWLITPPILLEEGKDYTFSIDYRAYSSTYPERMEILWGTSSNPAEGNMKMLLPPTDVTSNKYNTFQTIVRPETSGPFFFAVHDISGPNAMYLQVDNISIIEGANVADMNNAATITDFSELTTVLGGSVNASVTITNVGREKISSVTYVVASEEDGESAPVTVSIPEEPTFGNSAKLSIPLAASKQAHYSTRYITITGINGSENDVKTAARTAQGRVLTLQKSAQRRSVVEEFTGAWCANCTRGIAGLSRMEREHNDFIAIAVHGDDPMEIAPYRPVINLDIIPGYPFALIDRNVGCDPYFGDQDYSLGGTLGFGLEKVWDVQRQTLSEASLSLGTPMLDGDEVSFTTEVCFMYNSADAPYALAYVLLCDSVCRPKDKTSSQDMVDWAQANNLSGNMYFADNADLAPWVTSPYRIVNMAYDHVAVAATDMLNGIGGSIVAPLVCDATQTHTFSFNLKQIPLAQNRNKLKVVALLINTYSGRIVNADEKHVSDPTGIISPSTNNQPSMLNGTYDLQGRRITSPHKGLYIINGKKALCK